MRLGGDGNRPRRDSPFEGLSGNVCGACCGVAGIVIFVLLILAVVTGVRSVEITEVALMESYITRQVKKESFPAGRYFTGPFSHLIKFPAVVQTIQFSDSDLQSDLSSEEGGNPVLRSRTRDGLDVSIELSFQYQLNLDSLYELYTTLGDRESFHETFTRTAIDRLTEVATRYTANSFFQGRTEIGKKMEELLKDDFEKNLFSTIFSFQLRSVLLPQDFENAIQMTEVKKQDVHVAEAERNSTKIALETMLMQATRRTKKRSEQADAYAQSVLLENAAEIVQFNATQHLVADGYTQVLNRLGSKEDDLLNYIQSRVLNDHPSEKTTLGLSLPLIGAGSK